MKKIIFIATLAMACKSYDLKPVGENVKIYDSWHSLEESIKKNRDKLDSPFSKCRPIGEFRSNGGQASEKRNDKQSYDKAAVTPENRTA